MLRRREPIDKHLPRPRLHRVAGKLLRRELHHARHVRHLQAHRAAVRHPHETRVPHPALRSQTQRLRPDRKIPQRLLAAHRQDRLAARRCRHRGVAPAYLDRLAFVAVGRAGHAIEQVVHHQIFLPTGRGVLLQHLVIHPEF